MVIFCEKLFSLSYGFHIPQVDGVRHWFTDEHGRVRLFHGVNAVRKRFPWYPEYFLDDTHMDDLAALGMNVVRLGTMWSGVEPAEGYLNETYLDVIQDMIKRLADRGIYTMLDMHQDVMTAKYEGYDGIPRWLVDKYPEPTNPYPWPLPAVNFWEEGYFTQAVSEAFQHFYDNYAGSIDKWASFWETLALRYKDLPGMLGYNLINEPWVGDYISKSDLLLPGVAGRQNLMPNYNKVNDRIRLHDPDGIIFYEPILYGQLFQGDRLGSGFTQVPGGSSFINASVYSYHTYCWSLEFLELDATPEERRIAIEDCTANLLPMKFQSQAANVERTGGAAILTEFGLCKAAGDQKRVDIDCNVYMDLADEWLQSWVDWDHSDLAWFARDGRLNMQKVNDYVRTYAQAISGIPLSMRFDSATSNFHLKFQADPSILEPTEIFVPAIKYPNGYFVEVSEGLTWSSEGSIVLIKVSDASIINQESHVTIRAV